MSYTKSSVRDRVIQWQLQGTGASSDNLFQPNPKIKSASSKQKHSEIKDDRTRLCLTQLPVRNKHDVKATNSATNSCVPGKRVLSDHRWRKLESPEQRQTSKTDPNVSVRDGVDSATKTSSYDQDPRACILSSPTINLKDGSNSMVLDQETLNRNPAQCKEISFSNQKPPRRQNSNGHNTNRLRAARCRNASENSVADDNVTRRKSRRLSSWTIHTHQGRGTDMTGDIKCSSSSQRPAILDRLTGKSKKPSELSAIDANVVAKMTSIEAWLMDTQIGHQSDVSSDHDGYMAPTRSPRRLSQEQSKRISMRSSLAPLHANNETNPLDSATSEVVQVSMSDENVVNDQRQLSAISKAQHESTKRDSGATMLVTIKTGTRKCNIRSRSNDIAHRSVAKDRSSRNRKSRNTEHVRLASTPPETVGPNETETENQREKDTKDIENIIHQVLEDLVTHESKYTEDLCTLVDGVIPVLLSCILSKSDSPLANSIVDVEAGDLKHRTLTKPVIDMGIALERLKTLHKRIPLTNHQLLLNWTYGAHRAYSDYVQAWHMGFQDLVINLAPATANFSVKQATQSFSDTKHLPAVDKDTEKDPELRADVSYLLKRPLVHMKRLSTALERLYNVQPSNSARDATHRFQALIVTARLKTQAEYARLEDEAAYGVDTRYARDLWSLEPLTDVLVDTSNHVIARDNFDVTMQHSKGERIDCRIELILREQGISGLTADDLLICEVNATGRHLMFSPIFRNDLVALRGTKDTELILVAKYMAPTHVICNESLLLQADSSKTIDEWLQLLHDTSQLSVPDGIPEMQQPSIDSPVIGGELENEPQNSRMDMQATKYSQAAFGISAPVRSHSSNVLSIARLSDQASVRHAEVPPDHTARRSTGNPVNHVYADPLTAVESIPKTSLISAEVVVQNSSSNLNCPAINTRICNRERNGLRRATARRYSRSTNTSCLTTNGTMMQDSRLSSTDASKSMHTIESECVNDSPTDGPTNDEYGQTREHGSGLQIDAQQKICDSHVKRDRLYIDVCGKPSALTAPTVSDTMASLLNQQELTASESRGVTYVSSSPLKYEYSPSTTSKSGSAAKSIQSLQKDSDSITESSSYTDTEKLDGLASSLGVQVMYGRSVGVYDTPPASNFDSAQSINPDIPNSGAISQQYVSSRIVASLFTWTEKGAWRSLHPDECSVVISGGLVEVFEMSAAHSDLRPSICKQMLHKSEEIDTVPEAMDDQLPLIALELTPLVPLRRGTAIDISIRSPPTARSRIEARADIMLRCRAPEECDTLYSLLNHARFQNQTYIALQDARGSHALSGVADSDTQTGGAGGRLAQRNWSSMQRSSSYRAGNIRGLKFSTAEGSLGTTTSRFSAFGRFRRAQGAGIFNIALSTITSKGGTGGDAHSANGISENSSGAGLSTLRDIVANDDGSLGLRDAKIRFYVRENASRWRDMGAAHLTVLKVEVTEPLPLESLRPAELTSASLKHKRVLVRGKLHSETLLDVQLSERCFERVARTGIAVSVWKDAIGPNGEVGLVGAVGGVAGGKTTVYMIQFRSEAEAAYTFSLVGRLRG